METQRGGCFSVKDNAVNMSEVFFYVKVMTDEQLEVLRRQISEYAAICEQLPKTAAVRCTDAQGMRLGNLYSDPLMSSGGHKFAARQHWTPTPIQLQILESIFDQGNGTPSKQKIKDITNELTQHGQISETNVYNWFQNRRARSKRKHNTAPLQSNTESEAEAEIESPDEKKAKTSGEHVNQMVDDSSPSNSKSSGSLGQMAFYETMLSNSRVDHLLGKMEIPGSNSPFSLWREL